MAEWFPENQIITESLDFGDNGRIRQVYREMEAEFAALHEARRTDVPNDLTITLRARQEAELLKVPVIYSMIEDSLDEGKSVVVFLNFTAGLEAVRDKWQAAGGVCGMVGGGVHERDRDKWVDAFQADRLRVLLVNSAAGGAGLSLHDLHGNFPRVALISPDWNEKTFEQVLGRIFRAGGRSPALQKILVAADTVEERVVKNMRRKLANLSTLLAVQ
jgi:SNF2 family DNA or RNA helicase